MANPRHSENGDAYETIAEYSNVLDSSGVGGMFGASMRWPQDIFQRPERVDSRLEELDRDTSDIINNPFSSSYQRASRMREAGRLNRREAIRRSLLDRGGRPEPPQRVFMGTDTSNERGMREGGSSSAMFGRYGGSSYRGT